jgi:hypothetical protein
LPTGSDPEADRLWRRQVAQAAGRAADALKKKTIRIGVSCTRISERWKSA